MKQDTCKRCGSPITAGAGACPRCGAPVTGEPGRKFLVFFILLVVLCAIGILWLPR